MLIPESSTIGPIFPDNNPHYIIRVKPYYSDRLLAQPSPDTAIPDDSDAHERTAIQTVEANQERAAESGVPSCDLREFTPEGKLVVLRDRLGRTDDPEQQADIYDQMAIACEAPCPDKAAEYRRQAAAIRKAAGVVSQNATADGGDSA